MTYKELYMTLTTNFEIHEVHLESFKKIMSNLEKLGFEVLFKINDKFLEVNKDGNSIISATSVIGLYFRRIIVTLEKMSFQDLMVLYKNLVLYYEKGQRALTLGAIGVLKPTRSNIEENIMHSKFKWSLRQSEIFVAQQSVLLENDEINALPPKELHKKLSEIIHDNPLYPQAYFLSYMNTMRVRDLPNSIEALHRAFDRSTLKHYPLDDTVKRGIFQYSILNLAILHTLHGHKKEALKCLKESIMTAQENGDRVCLQLAQSWLCLLDNSNLQLSEKNIANKTEISLVHSVSLNIQSLVKVAALSGYLPSKLFDVLLKSDILNCQHSMMDLLSSCIAERAGLWTLYGKNEMASLCSQLLLNSSLKSLDKQHNGEGLCQSLCSLAIWMSLQGEYTISSLLLQHAKERFPRYPLSSNWMLCEYYITCQQAIYLEKWNDANVSCCNLYHLDKNLSLLMRASLNLSRGNRKLAQEFLDILLGQSEEDKELESLSKIRGMVLMAHTLIGNNFVCPDTITILNKASILAKEKYLDYEHSIVEMNLAYVLLRMEMPQQALKVIKCHLDSILANGGIYDKAKTIFLFVQILVAATETMESKLKRLEDTADLISKAIEYFTKLECYNKVKSIYYYLAKLYNDLNMHDERNKYALKFRLLAEQYTNNCNDNFNIFH